MEKNRLKKRRDVRREAILSSTKILLEKDGYQNFSLRSLAKYMDLTPGTIYFYFKDKETLIREVCDDDYLALASKEKKALTIKDPFERLFNVCLPYVDLAVKKPDQFRMLFLDPIVSKLPSDSRIKKGSDQEDPYEIFVAAVRGVLTRRNKNLSEDFVFSVAHLIWALGQGIGSLHISFKDEPWFKLFEPESQLRLGLKALIDGVQVKTLQRPKKKGR